MAIQDDNTILNKGDLKAYHERIAPMLGGTFMVGTNNSDYYSTDEKVVGVWTDGKPVYQKTIIADIPTAQEEGTDVTSTVTVSQNVDTFCHHNSQILVGRVTGEVVYFGEYANTGDSSYRNFTYLKTSSNALQVTFHNKYVSWYGKMITTVRYTKTTDTASSALTTPGAYDINFPNTWPANKEIFFGNGLYGQRFTGTYKCSSVTSSWSQAPTADILLMSASKVYHSVQQGGGAARYNGTFFPLVGTDTDGSLGLAFWFGSDGIHLRAKDNNTSTNTYDVWCTYTK